MLVSRVKVWLCLYQVELLVSILGWPLGGVGGTARMSRLPCCVVVRVLLVVELALDGRLLQQVLGVQHHPDVFGEGNPQVLSQLFLSSRP